MPISRESEGPQWQSARGSLPHIRTSRSGPNSTVHRLSTEQIPKLGNRRSPRVAQLDPTLSQKKLGSRIADLESQLGQAHVDLKNLKGQLTTAKAAKNKAQENIQKKTRKPKARDVVKVKDKHSHNPIEAPSKTATEIPDENDIETYVFEVPMEEMTMEDLKAEISETIDPETDETKPISELIVLPPELESPSFDILALKENEINLLKAKLGEKYMELEVSRLENESLQAKLNEAAMEKSITEAKQEEIKVKLVQLGLELAESKASESVLKKKLEDADIAKAGLENEMRKMKVQTEQWRKAAEAAAAVLMGGVEMDGRRVPERCGSMDKHISNKFDPVYNGYVGSPGLGDDSDDGTGGGKRRSSSIKMFGDLWRKKGQK